MKSRISTIIIIFIFQGVSFFYSSFAFCWELVKERNGIQVYARPNPGHNVDEFKVTAVLDVRIEVVLVLLKEINNQPKWMDKCVEGRLLKEYNIFERMIYNVTDLPWPFSDRDIVVHQILEFDDRGRVRISFTSVKDDNLWVPRDKDKVRMTTFKGSWTLEAVDKDHTHATYIIKADPAGEIPACLANYASRFIPYRTMENVIELTHTQEAQYFEEAKRIHKNFPEFWTKYMKARIRATVKEIADQELTALLVQDKELIESLSNSEQELKEVVQNRIQTNYVRENGKWLVKTN